MRTYTIIIPLATDYVDLIPIQSKLIKYYKWAKIKPIDIPKTPGNFIIKTKNNTHIVYLFFKNNKNSSILTRNIGWPEAFKYTFEKLSPYLAHKKIHDILIPRTNIPNFYYILSTLGSKFNVNFIIMDT